VKYSDDALSDAQMKDLELEPIIQYLKNGVLPEDGKLTKKVVTESILYAISNNMLYYVDPKQTEISRVVVPQQMHRRMM